MQKLSDVTNHPRIVRGTYLVFGYPSCLIFENKGSFNISLVLQIV